MIQKHFFDMINNKIDPYKEFTKLKKLFEDEFFINDSRTSIKEIVEVECFQRLSFRGMYLTLNELEEDLNFSYEQESYDLNSLLLYCEYLYAILNETELIIVKFSETIKRIEAIYQNINFIVEHTNHEWYTDPDTFYNLIVEKNEIVNVALNNTKNENIKTQLNMYLNHINKHNHEKKRNILNTLAREIEPILNSNNLKKNNFGYIESDLGKLLNKFHIRHNNLEGSKKYDLIKTLTDSELEEWYDKVYYLIVSVIIINNTIQISKELKELTGE